MTKACIACAEDIKAEAKLCKHCGTVQSSADFSSTSTTAINETDEVKSKKFKNACPKCNQVDSIAKVSSIVDSSTQTSTSMGFISQIGAGSMPYTNLSLGTSSSQLADRLSIGIPEAQFNYRFVDFCMGLFFAAAGSFGLVFKEGSPLDAGPFNVLFASICSLAIGPILGIFTATTRKNNEANKIYELQILMSKANDKLRKAYYCSRDDVVFNGKMSGSPEEFIEALIAKLDDNA